VNSRRQASWLGAAFFCRQGPIVGRDLAIGANPVVGGGLSVTQFRWVVSVRYGTSLAAGSARVGYPKLEETMTRARWGVLVGFFCLGLSHDAQATKHRAPKHYREIIARLALDAQNKVFPHWLKQGRVDDRHDLSGTSHVYGHFAWTHGTEIRLSAVHQPNSIGGFPFGKMDRHPSLYQLGVAREINPLASHLALEAGSYGGEYPRINVVRAVYGVMLSKTKGRVLPRDVVDARKVRDPGRKHLGVYGFSNENGMAIVDLVKTSKGIVARQWTVQGKQTRYADKELSADMIEMCRQMATLEVDTARPVEELSRVERAERVAIVQQALFAQLAESWGRP
jgi:hypothetical protein